MVKWTPEVEAKLLTALFEKIDIKFSGELLQHLAEVIGDGCTPKAVTHRLQALKARGKAVKTEDGGAKTPNASPVKKVGARTPSNASPTKKAANTSAKKSATAPRGRKRKVEKSESDGEEAGDVVIKKIKMEEADDGDKDEEATLTEYA